MNRILCVVVAAVAFPCLSEAAERPSPEEVRKVVDYYVNGAGEGVVLIEALLCRAVVGEGESRGGCAGRLEVPIEKGREAYIWMNYLVPLGPPADIVLTFTRDGKVRSVVEFRPKPSIHYRTWARIPTGVAGTWGVEIVQELSGRDLHLLDIRYEVVAADTDPERPKTP